MREGLDVATRPREWHEEWLAQERHRLEHGYGRDAATMLDRTVRREVEKLIQESQSSIR